MQLFGGDFTDVADTDEPVMRFDNFYQSFLSLFQVSLCAITVWPSGSDFLPFIIRYWQVKIGM